MSFKDFKITGICGVVWGITTGIAAFIVLLIFGIMALVPAGPFHERNKTAGIIMLVLTGTLVTLAGGFFAGGAVGALLGLPLDAINNCC